MHRVLLQRNFALLWFGQLISGLGSFVLFISLPFYVYNLTHSALTTGLMFLTGSVPSLLFGSLAGVFVDRWNHKWTLVATDLMRAGLLFLLLLVRSVEWIWLVYVVAFVEASITQFFYPANNAFIPHLVREEQLVAANALNALNQSFTRLIGAGLGAFLIERFGIAGVIVADCLSYLISGGLTLFISISPDRVARDSQERALRSLAREWREGLHFVRQKSWMVRLFIIMGLSLLSEGMFITPLVLYARNILHDEAWFGWMLMVQGIGNLLGGLCLPAISRRVQPDYLIGGAGIIGGLLCLIVFTYPVYWLSLALFFVIGFVSLGIFVTVPTLLQQKTPGGYSGRVFGSLSALQSLLYLSGIGIVSVLGDHINVILILDIASSLYLIVGCIMLVTARRAVA